MENFYYHYLIHFTIMLIAGSIFCIGLFMSSRGESEIAPDGTCVDKWAMIFYPVTKFLCKTKVKCIYYCGESLEKLYAQIKIDFPHDTVHKETNLHLACLESVNGYWAELLPKIEEKYGVKICIDNAGYIKFWKEYEVFIYPSILFKPIIGCYKCYASFWGTIVFYLGTKLSIYLEYIPCDYNVLIPMWIFYCLSLVTANCLLYKTVKD